MFEFCKVWKKKKLNFVSSKEKVEMQELKDFYKEKCGWLPDSLQRELGHFNVFRLENFVGDDAQPVPYKRRDFYKITFFKGSAQLHYADRAMEVRKYALVFSNPQIPYKWEGLESVERGNFCIFNQEFFRSFGEILEYSVFRVGGVHLFELSEAQAEEIMAMFQKMEEEMKSNYLYKYDILRMQVMEMIHYAMKLQPSFDNEIPQRNASHRISTLFTELLERQFPIENRRQAILRTASDYAKQLNIHTNHLNRAVKEITGKTTTEIINDRVLQESKVLLKHTDLNISEIAYLLGFNEATHFSGFFKRQTEITPNAFRKVQKRSIII